MVASAYRNMAHSFQRALKEPGHAARRALMMEWRRENAVHKLVRPSRLDRAHALGWRSKPGYVLLRVRLRRGGQRKRHIIAGRRPKHKGVARMVLGKSIQRIAEERAAKKHPNLEVLNSYWVGEDGPHKFFEVILVDPSHPQITADPRINWICDPAQSGRAYRGLTSAGKRGRGLRWKGKGVERMRPSRKANQKYVRRTQSKVIP